MFAHAAQALTEQSQARVNHLALAFAKHHAVAKTGADDSLAALVAQNKADNAHHAERKYATSWPQQLITLSKRAFSIALRDKATNFAQLGQTIVFSVILALIWMNEAKGLGSTGTVPSIAGCLFFIAVNQAFGSMFGIIFMFPAERGIVLKERASRTYHVGAYFLSKSVVELPRTLLMALLFSAVTYPSVSLRSGFGHFILYWIVLVMVAAAAQGIACVAFLFDGLRGP